MLSRSILIYNLILLFGYYHIGKVNGILAPLCEGKKCSTVLDQSMQENKPLGKKDYAYLVIKFENIIDKAEDQSQKSTQPQQSVQEQEPQEQQEPQQQSDANIQQPLINDNLNQGRNALNKVNSHHHEIADTEDEEEEYTITFINNPYTNYLIPLKTKSSLAEEVNTEAATSSMDEGEYGDDEVDETSSVYEDKEEIANKTTSEYENNKEEVSEISSSYDNKEEEVDGIFSIYEKKEEEADETSSAYENNEEVVHETSPVYENKEEKVVGIFSIYEDEVDETSSVYENKEEEVDETSSVYENKEEEVDETSSVYENKEEEVDETSSVYENKEEKVVEIFSIYEDDIDETSPVYENKEEEVDETSSVYENKEDEVDEVIFVHENKMEEEVDEVETTSSFSQNQYQEEEEQDEGTETVIADQYQYHKSFVKRNSSNNNNNNNHLAKRNTSVIEQRYSQFFVPINEYSVLKLKNVNSKNWENEYIYVGLVHNKKVYYTHVPLLWGNGKGCVEDRSVTITLENGNYKNIEWVNTSCRAKSCKHGCIHDVKNDEKGDHKRCANQNLVDDKCDIYIYIGWAGTDKDGKTLLDSAQSIYEIKNFI